MTKKDNSDKTNLPDYVFSVQLKTAEISEILTKTAQILGENVKEYGEKVKEKLEKYGPNALTGVAVGAARNASNFVIKVGGRASNILNIYDKNSISALGNPRWFARIDMPHGKVPYHHINVNKAVTGMKDPHIQISELTANVAGAAGKGLDVMNKMSPMLTVTVTLWDLYRVAGEVKTDFENGSKRNTAKVLANILAARAGANGGAAIGKLIGTRLLTGVGTMAGGLVVAIPGAILASGVADFCLELVLDAIKVDIEEKECKKCQKKFECRKHETGDVEVCEECRTDEDLPKKWDWSEVKDVMVKKIKSKL